MADGEEEEGLRAQRPGASNKQLFLAGTAMIAVSAVVALLLVAKSTGRLESLHPDRCGPDQCR